MTVSKISLLALICSFAAIPALAVEITDRATQAGLVPHKALYDIRLVSTRSGSQIINVDGQMMYEWRRSCEAWISDHRFDLKYEYADSHPMRITSDFSTYETFDGEDMNFTSQRKREGQLFEEIRGRATLKPSGAGAATFSIPKELEYDIPAGGVFPMGHTLGLMESLKAGKVFYNATIFDGSDDEGPVNVNAFIGKPVEKLKDVPESQDIDKALIPMPARNVQLAFFPLKDETGLADYEMDLVFHETGVISEMVVKYEDFTVSQTLRALEKADGPPCD